MCSRRKQQCSCQHQARVQILATVRARRSREAMGPSAAHLLTTVCSTNVPGRPYAGVLRVYECAMSPYTNVAWRPRRSQQSRNTPSGTCRFGVPAVVGRPILGPRMTRRTGLLGFIHRVDAYEDARARAGRPRLPARSRLSAWSGRLPVLEDFRCDTYCHAGVAEQGRAMPTRSSPPSADVASFSGSRRRGTPWRDSRDADHPPMALTDTGPQRPEQARQTSL
jgi:hypothetical protein